MPNRWIQRALLLAALLSTPAFAADGDLDPGFGVGGIAYLPLDGIEGHELRSHAVIALPDDKLLFGGSRNLLIEGNPDPHMRATLARLDANGQPDASFGTDPSNPGLVVLPDVAGTGIQQVEAMQRLADGSIVLAGSANAFGPLTGFVMKVDADGRLDAGFGTDGIVTIASTYLHALVLDDQERILVAGERSANFVSKGFVARLDAGGRFDASFGPNDDGTYVFEPRGTDENGYIAALALDGNGRIVVAGAYESWGPGMGTEFSIARLDADGALDATFAAAGWRVFHMPDDVSNFNGINRMLVLPDGRLQLAAYRIDETSGVGIVLARLDADGATDATFGSDGYQRIDVAPEAWNRYPSALLRLADGKLLVGVSYASPVKQEFLAFRTDAGGALDAGFADAGVLQLDLAPEGIYSDLTVMTLQAGKPILAGGAMRSTGSRLVDLAAVRLQVGGEGPADRIFDDGFEGAPVEPVTSHYDDLEESFLGTSYAYNGVTYRDVNGIGGVFPDGSTFVPADVGDQVIIENAGLFYNDFPQWGSTPNVMTFGTTYVNGSNFSIGALVRASMDLDVVANAVDVQLAYYENGPWGGIELRLDAYLDGSLVGSDSFTISNLGGRDNVTTATLAIAGVEFDALQLHATYDGQPSAPRVMIDDLRLTPAL